MKSTLCHKDDQFHGVSTEFKNNNNNKNLTIYISTKDVCTFMADLCSVIEFLGFNVRISG